MKPIRSTLFAGLLFGCMLTGGGCAGGPPVTSKTTPGTDFAKYHTYAIRPGNVAYPGAPPEQREAVAERIQASVAAALEARGLVPQPDEPDLIVTYTAGARQGRAGSAPGVRLEEGVDVRGPAGTGYDEPGAVIPRDTVGGPPDLDAVGSYREGSLVLDMLDGKSRRLVWRATAEIELASPRGARMLDGVVERAIKDLPLGNRAQRAE